jgi:hypothetical protein
LLIRSTLEIQLSKKTKKETIAPVETITELFPKRKSRFIAGFSFVSQAAELI